MPVVFVLCVVGAFAITSRVFDIYVMLVFGLIGFVLRELKFPMAPLILGLVLGDLLEKNLTRGLVLSDGSLLPFFTRPVCAVLAAITILSILWSIPAVNQATPRACSAASRDRAPADRRRRSRLTAADPITRGWLRGIGLIAPL